MISVIVPGYNVADTVGACLDALLQQTVPAQEYEIIFVDDGSWDGTCEIVSHYTSVRLLKLGKNCGPAAARNVGLQKARGDIVLFTDADCAPAADWIEAMCRPFQQAEVSGCKGIYRTRQRELVARFVQLEYESRYCMMERLQQIDFVDTYAAGYRRDVLLQQGGFDERLRVDEDQELSFRLTQAGHKLIFNPRAVVYHQHVKTLRSYLSRKFWIGYWKAFVLRRHPAKMLRDSHTPSSLKAELALTVLALLCAALSPLYPPLLWGGAAAIAIFLFLSIPFMLYILRRDAAVSVVTLPLLFTRALALGSGLIAGSLHLLVFGKR